MTHADSELEALIDKELRMLPAPKAPRTLLPQVMAMVGQCPLRPWYTRAWLTWPLGWKLASAAALALLVAGGAWFLPGPLAGLASAASRFTPDVIAQVAAFAERAEATSSVVRLLWRAVLEPFFAYAFAIVVLMCLVCAAFATALNHLAFGRTLPS